MSGRYMIFQDALPQVATIMAGMDFHPSAGWRQPIDALVAIVGITGADRGTIQLEMGLSTAIAIACAMSGEQQMEQAEMMLCIGELANTMSGVGVSRLNNSEREHRYWLTPPVVFVGESLQVSTPGRSATSLFYQGPCGDACVKIGFEGV